MLRRRLIAVVATGVLAIVALLAVWWPAGRESGRDQPTLKQLRALETKESRPKLDRQIVAPKPDGTLLLPEADSLARELNAPGHTAEDDLQTLQTLVNLFKKANQGAIPAGGLNEEFVAAMLGRNALHFAVLPADCPGLASDGELLDRWGTPYFMHPLSREILEIRSAGPDRKMFTEDDIQLNDEAGAEIKR